MTAGRRAHFQQGMALIDGTCNPDPLRTGSLQALVYQFAMALGLGLPVLFMPASRRTPAELNR
jgi:hypothetical protein